MIDKPMQRILRQEFALVYAALLPQIQKRARQQGYAIAVHGSMSTDLDLLACPWTDEAAEAEVLVEDLRQWFSLVFQPPCSLANPTLKPHGRRAWALQLDHANSPYPFYTGGPYLDISVMPKQKPERRNPTMAQPNPVNPNLQADLAKVQQDISNLTAGSQAYVAALAKQAADAAANAEAVAAAQSKQAADAAANADAVASAGAALTAEEQQALQDAGVLATDLGAPAPLAPVADPNAPTPPANEN